MADPNLLMQIRTAQMPSMVDSMQRVAGAKAEMLKSKALQSEIDQQAKLDELYKSSGGDINAMMKNPDIGFVAGMKLREMQSAADANKFKAQNEQIDYLLKQSEYSAQQASGVQDQAGWDRVRQHVGQVLGPDAMQHIPEQFSEQAKTELINGAMSFKDRIAQQRADQQAMQQDRMYNATMERIAASERNAAARGEGGDSGKWKVDLERGVRYNDQGDVIPLQGGAVQKPESAAEKMARIKIENENRLADKDFANSLTAAKEAQNLFEGATGSGLGKARDAAYAMVGKSTEGAQKAAQLKVVAGKLVAAVPKFSGPQSDKDVQLYREMAGQVGDESIPIETRQAALQTVIALQSAEAERRKLLQNPSTVENNQNRPALSDIFGGQ